LCARQTSPHAWFRLVNLLPDEQLRDTLLAFAASNGPSMPAIRAVVSRLLCVLLESSVFISSRHQRLWLISSLLFRSARNTDKCNDSSNWQLPAHLRLSTEQWSKLKGSLASPECDKGVLKSLCSSIRHSPARQALEAESPEVTKPDLSEPDRIQASDQAAETVSYAGAVLLHPYLNSLFKACGIEVVKRRIPSGLNEKAASLLSFLITGRDDVAEFHLDFLKLLLGLPREIPLPLGGGVLGESEKLEALRLLESFIDHWKSLKGTSIEGVRRTFLQRPGMLRQTDEGFLLQIERTGIDVLLDRFPYSYSVVKMPWMPKPIYVEW